MSEQKTTSTLETLAAKPARAPASTSNLEDLTPAVEPKPEPIVSKPLSRLLPNGRKRIPMSVPQRKLEVPEIPGYHLHWFREINVPRALQAAYEFVKMDELPINQLNTASSVDSSGNTDLGTNVRVIGAVTELNHPEYLVLMKLREEYWREDRQEIDAQAARRMQAIFRDEVILDDPNHPADADTKALRYVKTAVFNRPTRKVKQVTNPF
jgi:hypothetical protein